MVDCGLHDLGMTGFEFTWEKSRGTGNWVEHRALEDLTRCSLFNNAKVFNLQTFSLDHTALFLDFIACSTLRSHHFRFEIA